jgi:hypothetical protein
MGAVLRIPTPGELLRLSADEADQVLDELERTVPVRSAVVDLPGPPIEEAVVFGDTHGDWRSTVAVSRRFLSAVRTRIMVGLGDYVDRAPVDCGEGSVANALFLLSLTAAYPDRVFLLQGNHETHRIIPVIPHDLPEEVDQLWGPEAERYTRILGLLERGPLAAVTSSGVYLAHAGFPRVASTNDWKAAVDPRDQDTLLDIVWGDCEAARSHRGIAVRFDEPDLDRFLRSTGLHVFVRGHDPDLSGRSIYHHHCLTLHTSRTYERFGGVIIAHVPIARPVRTTDDLQIEHLDTEGQRYPEP